jgi:hypothetical protein
MNVVYRLVSDVVSGLLGWFENEGSQTNRLLVWVCGSGYSQVFTGKNRRSLSGALFIEETIRSLKELAKALPANSSYD